MQFTPFPKISRLSRDVVITEKLDGTNAQVAISVFENPTFDDWDKRPDGDSWWHDFSGRTFAKHGGVVYVMYAGSRTRWVTPSQDNHGWAKWVLDNASELVKLGEGSHFGEWWGQGIQRNYSQTTKRFSLFNTHRWGDVSVRPTCCDVVPVLYQGPLEEHGVMKGLKYAMGQLQAQGSAAAPGFMRPEGVVIFHAHSNTLFKKTFEKDDKGKDFGA